MACRFIHQYPAAAMTTSVATIAMRARGSGRAGALPLPVATGGAADDATALGTALAGTFPRDDRHLPQNLASAAFSNPHLQRIDCSLPAPNYQRAATMILVIQALNSRMIGTAGAAPASEISPIREHPAYRMRIEYVSANRKRIAMTSKFAAPRSAANSTSSPVGSSTAPAV